MWTPGHVASHTGRPSLPRRSRQMIVLRLRNSRPGTKPDADHDCRQDRLAESRDANRTNAQPRACQPGHTWPFYATLPHFPVAVLWRRPALHLAQCGVTVKCPAHMAVLLPAAHVALCPQHLRILYCSRYRHIPQGPLEVPRRHTGRSGCIFPRFPCHPSPRVATPAESRTHQHDGRTLGTLSKGRLTLDFDDR